MPDLSSENPGINNLLQGLFLFPVPIHENPVFTDWLGPELRSLLTTVQLVVCENERTARRFISSLKLGVKIDSYCIVRLDKDSGLNDLKEILLLLQQYGKGILMSEAGCPAIADPGSELVKLCHRNGIPVHPLTGPSSIFLALMGSGLSGQRFFFQGYLPIDRNECSLKIRQLERESLRDNCTQIFIETPYRNKHLWDQLIQHLSSETLLCFARNLGSPLEEIRMKSVREWRNEKLDWEKSPCVFLFMAPASNPNAKKIS